MPVRSVLLAEPRGFCAGVEMAIKALAWMVRLFPAPVYCYHEIVHNRLIVERFENLGVVFVDCIDAVPAGAPLMLSAHGSAPEIVNAAQSHDRFVVNAVCPLVTKVHHEARVRSEKGYTILYVGHAGHDEAVGTLAVAPDAIRLVEHDTDLDAALAAVDEPDKVALLAQTTLALHDWEGIADAARDRFPDLWTATRNDLCFATTNRQSALSAIAARADAVVVIGSANSSNTIALAKVAAAAGSPLVVRIDGPEELDLATLGDAEVVGVTAGASAPEDLVQAVIAALAPTEGVDLVHVTEEDEYFPPPRELRELIPADDRTISAADVLADLVRSSAGATRRVEVGLHAVLHLTTETFRLFLHVLAATVWVGGQLTLGVIIPALRPAPDDPDPEAARARIRAVARRFQVAAWISFGVLLVTGVWNLTATPLGDQSSAWLTTLMVKLVCVAISGTAAAVHIVVAAPRVRTAHDDAARRKAAAFSGACEGLAVLFAVASLYLGVLLHG